MSSLEPCKTLCVIHGHTSVIILGQDHGSIDFSCQNMVVVRLGIGKDGVIILVSEKGDPSLGNSSRRNSRDLLLLSNVSNDILVGKLFTQRRRKCLHDILLVSMRRSRLARQVVVMTPLPVALRLTTLSSRRFCSTAFIVRACLPPEMNNKVNNEKV